MIRTEPFAIAPSATAAFLARQWLGRRWLFWALPAVAALLAGLADVRYVVVALMIVFIAWPMALSFVWFGDALAPEAVRASHPHAVEFDEHGISVEYIEREGFATPAAEHVAWTDVRTVEHGKSYVCFGLHSGHRILVPAGAIAAQQWRQVAEWRR